MDFWYLRISRSATVPGRYLCGFLDAAGGGRGLARRLGGELLAGGLATGGLTGSLLGTSHLERCAGGCDGGRRRTGLK